MSLRGVLDEIVSYPDILSRQHYLALHQDRSQRTLDRANNEFDRIGGAGGLSIRPSVVNRDVRRLASPALVSVESWADRRTAHWHDARNVPPGTFNDLRRGIATLESVLRRYLLLLTGTAPVSLVPTIQYDWQEPFTFPWM